MAGFDRSLSFSGNRERRGSMMSDDLTLSMGLALDHKMEIAQPRPRAPPTPNISTPVPELLSGSPPPPPTPAGSPGPIHHSYEDYFDSVVRRHFQNSSSQQRNRLLADLLNMCSTQQLSFVHQFVSPLLKKDPFTSMPNEICLRILCYVNDPQVLARASQVSRRWRDLLSDDATWRNLCTKHAYGQRIANCWKTHFKHKFLVESAWKTGGRNTIKTITNDGRVVTNLHLTSKYIVVALDNARIHIFDREGNSLRTLNGHVMGVWAMVPWDDVLVSGGCDRDVRVWDMASGNCMHTLRGHTSTVRCLRMSDATTAISGSRDTTLRVWDVKTGSCKRVLLGHQASVRCLETKGDIVVSGSYDATAKIWSISEGRCLHTLTGHFSQIYAIAYDGHRVVTGSLDTSVRVWDANTGQGIALLQGHTSLVGQLQLRGNTLVTGGSDGSVRVWSLDKMSPIHRLAAHDNSVTSLQFDDTRVVSGGSDGRVKVWDLKTGQLVRELISAESVWRVVFEDEKCVAVASRGTRVMMDVWSFSQLEDTGKELETSASALTLASASAPTLLGPPPQSGQVGRAETTDGGVTVDSEDVADVGDASLPAPSQPGQRSFFHDT